jgi:hypothetical protein
MVGVVMQSLLKHHDNVRRAKRSTWFSGINSREAASAFRPSRGARLAEPYRGVSSGGGADQPTKGQTCTRIPDATSTAQWDFNSEAIASNGAAG